MTTALRAHGREFEYRLLERLFEWVAPAEVRAIGIIGSYAEHGSVLPGSDVDIVTVVTDLSSLRISPSLAFNKIGRVVDPQGERFEFNVLLPEGVVVDVTVVDRFNSPNNPMRDQYENHLGWCRAALTLWGPSLGEVFEVERLVDEYLDLRARRLELVEDKIAMTKAKLCGQGRLDLHCIFELEQYVFVREVIRAGIFNRRSLKHADSMIPLFRELFAAELRDDCGVVVTVERVGGLG